MEIADLADLYGKEFHIKQISSWLRGSARSQEIRKRIEDTTDDGKTLDEHDQFYRDHKLLLVLFRVLGVMPIERSEIGKITFSWISPSMIYSYIFYLTTSILVCAVGYERVDILLNKSKAFDEYIYSIIFVVYLLPHFWIPFVGWGVANEVCDYKNTWTRFQLNYYKVTGKNIQFPHLNTLIIVISLGCLILAVVFLLTLNALLDGYTLYHTSAYLHIITMLNMNSALWYINCRAIGNASTTLADSFEKDINQHCCSYIIAHYRVLWLTLSDILQKLGNAFARTYSTYTLFMMMNITIGVYGFTSKIVDHGVRFSFKEIGLIVEATYCLTLMYIYCDCSHQASLNIANRVQTALLNVKLSTVDVDTAKEIELFLIAIQMNPPKVSLKGYTVVNRELVSGSISTIAIYLIVLLQFKISLINMRG